MSETTESIGYMNPATYPINFLLSNGTPITVDAGKAVINNKGFLVVNNAELNEQLHDGTLKLIVKGCKGYDMFKLNDQKAKQKAGANVTTADERRNNPPRVARPQANSNPAPQQPVPEVSVPPTPSTPSTPSDDIVSSPDLKEAKEPRVPAEKPNTAVDGEKAEHVTSATKGAEQALDLPEGAIWKEDEETREKFIWYNDRRFLGIKSLDVYLERQEELDKAAS
jgi:hypothetical protein